MLAKAITLIESNLPADQQLAGDLIDAVIDAPGNSLRIGITGAPGVGKSTFIESFGRVLLAAGHRVAVLTIDPTSQITGGSILGDKTRMLELARDERAFIRPSPSGQTLGGVASHTRETIMLCEAAGFDRIIVETVGTGQSEITMRTMVDFFLLLIQPGSGDELQGIKKGIVEMADAIAITKADGDNVRAAKSSQADFVHALHFANPQPSGWTPKVVTCSAVNNSGLVEIVDMIESFRATAQLSGLLETNRRKQRSAWFHDHFQFLLANDPKSFSEWIAEERSLTSMVRDGQVSPRQAARRLLEAYHRAVSNRG